MSEPAAVESATRTVATRGTALFFAAAFAITWALQLPAAFAQLGLLAGPFERLMPLAGVGIFGPLLAAVLATRLEPGSGGVRALFRPLLAWRVGAGWYVVALALPGAILTGSLAVHALAAGHDVRWTYFPADAQHIAALVVVPFAEEIGWRGFALPRLQRRHGAIAGSLILGVLWAIWHLPMFLAAGVPISILPAMLPFFAAGSVTLTWIYNRTGGSLLLAVLAHMGAHLDNSHAALPGDATPVLAHTVGYVVVAVVLVLADRRVWRAPYPGSGT